MRCNLSSSQVPPYTHAVMCEVQAIRHSARCVAQRVQYVVAEHRASFQVTDEVDAFVSKQDVEHGVSAF